MEFIEYQRKARETAVYPVEMGLPYTALGLVGEAGEVANKVKKMIRDNATLGIQVADEIGDVLWYCAMLADELGISLEEIAWRNLDKLRLRKERGTIQGNGDER